MRALVVIVVGLAATLLTELAVAMLMGYAPTSWPMVDRYWLMTAFPAITLVVLLCTLLLWPIYRRGQLRYPIAFMLAYLVGIAIELSYFQNDSGSIARYLIIGLAVCLVLLGGLYQLRWRRQS